MLNPKRRMTSTQIRNSSNKLFTLEAKTQNTRHVGKYISTKKVGADEREDITHLYKHPENSAEERNAFDTAYGFGRGPKKWEGLLDIEKEGNDLKFGMYMILHFENVIRSNTAKISSCMQC